MSDFYVDENEAPIEKYSAPLLVMKWNVWVSGTMLEEEKKRCITSLELTETVEGADSAVITISDPQFLFLEDNIFLEDNPVRIMLGWDNTTYREDFQGYISTINIQYGTDGIPVLTLTCMDNTHIMNREKKDRTFKDTTSAEVVKNICAEYGYTCVVEEGYDFEVQETITQSHQTDIDFITGLAENEVYPFTARLVGEEFQYVKMGKLDTPKQTLTYRKYPYEIISFTPQINKESKQVEIKSSKTDTENKSVNNASAKTGSSYVGGVSTSGNASSAPQQTYTSPSNNSGGNNSSSGGSRTIIIDTDG